MNFLFRILLTFNATSFLLIVFLAQEGYGLASVMALEGGVGLAANILTYFAYAAVPVGLTGLSILCSSSLGSDAFRSGEIVAVELENNRFLPSYLAYFFVALSVSGWEALVFVYIVVFVFTFVSQALYFNPLFLLYGYDFYNVTTRNGVVFFLISQNKYKDPESVLIRRAYRVNDYTFIERGD